MAKASVDLLTSIQQPKSTWEKIFDWSFSIGRYLVVFVEAIVLVAFVLRFAMDRAKNDLDRNIAQKVTLLKFYEEAGKIENLELNSAMLVGADQIIKTQPVYSRLVQDVTGLVGTNGTIQNINIRDNIVRIKGTCRGLAESEKIEDAFRTSENLVNVQFNLTQSSDNAGGVSFTIDAGIPTKIYSGNYISTQASGE